MSGPGAPQLRSLGELLMYHLGLPSLLETTVNVSKTTGHPRAPFEGSCKPRLLSVKAGRWPFPREGLGRGGGEGDECGNQGLLTADCTSVRH